VYKWFGIDFDYWGRTSTPKHTEIVQSLFLELHKKGFISEKALEQLFCETCAMFLADRFVEGTCPHCEYVGARGDQCDYCGKLIDAVTLVNPHCSVCKTTPVKKTSNHLFLDLKALQKQVQVWKDERGPNWSKNAQIITQTWLDGGLEQRCITRDLKWGVPVPLEGWEDKVFYVWFDACIGYISITANYTDDWEKWWKSPDNVELFQFMGKDNVPFHTVVFPATLLGSGGGWTSLKNLSTTEYLNYEGGKFSKSKNTGVFGADVLKEGISPHIWRYYLLATRPETVDAEFQWEDFVSKTNTEFVANVGNFVYRVLNLLSKAPYNKAIPKWSGELTEEAKKFVADIENKISEYISLMDKLQLREGLRTAMQVSTLVNGYLTAVAPWSLVKTNPEGAADCLFLVAQATSVISSLLSPFVPTFSEELSRQLNFPIQKVKGPSFSFDIPSGHCIAEDLKVIIELIDGDRIAEWWDRYGSAHLTTMTSLELKVGLIVKLEDHPEGGEKYVCHIKTGPNDPISVVARLGHLYKPEQLLNTKVVVLTNLKPGKFQGVPSQGMILGAEDKDGVYGLLRVVDPNNECTPGSRVTPEGWSCKPTPNMNIKEFQKAKLYTKEGGSIWWDSEKRTPEVKKQPTKNPKAQGKNKAAPKKSNNKKEIVSNKLVATDIKGSKIFEVICEEVKKHPAKIK
jgi:methionyl-tRNA synthetase